MTEENRLWMGKLEPYMTRSFIRNAFEQMGENISGVSVRRSNSGERVGYCFVQYEQKNVSRHLLCLIGMHKLREKLIPGSEPPVKFFLSHCSLTGKDAMKTNYRLKVNRLSLEVDDCTLFEGFYARYPSVRCAQVAMDAYGTHRGFGFVRFAKEKEQKKALIEMDGFQGIGSKFIRVEVAVDKEKSHEGSTSSSFRQTGAELQGTWSGQPHAASSATTTQTDYSQYYEQNWIYYASSVQWPNYGNYYDPVYPAYDHALLQRTTQQPPMMPTEYQGDAYPMGMQIAQSSQQVGQQQTPTRQQSPMMPTAYQGDAYPMGMQMAQSSQQVGQQQPNPLQLSMMPTSYQGDAYPMGMQMAQSSQQVGQQSPNPLQIPRTPAAYVPPILPTPPIGMQMSQPSQHVGQQQPIAWQSAAYQAATHRAPMSRRRKAEHLYERQDDQAELFENYGPARKKRK